MTSSDFQLDREAIDLPTGAWARTRRRILRWRGREVFGLSQGQFRAYLYPVFTPGGFAVTSESPADHPHHHSIWIGSDHVHCLVPAAEGKHEEYTYNLYVNETFQGRAPGAIMETATNGEPVGADRFRVTQSLEWRGPSEWAAWDGRVLAREERMLDVAAAASHYVIDVRSRVSPTEWDLVLGPTRHAYLNVRVAESIKVEAGGAMLDSRGNGDAHIITGSDAEWVGYSGPVGGGNNAGVAVMPHPDCGKPWWFVTDWGVITVGHYRDRQMRLPIGETAEFRFRVVVHDGDAAAAGIDELYRNYIEGSQS
ncbi:MAG TPA: DUF6807 family protein [Alphaproteobacteria bacterium]|nr:DUF6807 family protein [Alphaproteobacteria bacterium]